jgi:hypothetical protein
MRIIDEAFMEMPWYELRQNSAAPTAFRADASAANRFGG